MSMQTASPPRAVAIGFSGKVRDFPVRELLRMLCLSSRTGSLQLSAGRQRAQLELDNGKIIRAWTLQAHTNLGDILKKWGKLSDPALQEAVRIQSAGPERVPLGKILVQLGFVTMEDVDLAMRDQVQAAILEIVGWRSGEFTFVDTRSSAVDDIALGVPDALFFSSTTPAGWAGRPPAGVPRRAVPPPAAEDDDDAPISSLPIVCVGSGEDSNGFVHRLAELYPGATLVAPGEDPVDLLRRAFEGTDQAAVIVDGRGMEPSLERGRLALIERVHRSHPDVPLLLVHDGLTRRSRERFRRAGASALVELDGKIESAISVERSFGDFFEAMSQALFSRRSHALEDTCCG